MSMVLIYLLPRENLELCAKTPDDVENDHPHGLEPQESETLHYCKETADIG